MDNNFGFFAATIFIQVIYHVMFTIESNAIKYFLFSLSIFKFITYYLSLSGEKKLLLFANIIW